MNNISLMDKYCQWDFTGLVLSVSTFIVILMV